MALSKTLVFVLALFGTVALSQQYVVRVVRGIPGQQSQQNQQQQQVYQKSANQQQNSQQQNQVYQQQVYQKSANQQQNTHQQNQVYQQQQIYQIQSQQVIQQRNANQQAADARDQQAQVTSYVNDYNPQDGSFNYGYEQSNGVSVNAKGYMRDGHQVMEGSYSLQTADGTPIRIQYVADENGFYPTGDAIPTPHPAIAKALEYIKTLPPQPENEKF